MKKQTILKQKNRFIDEGGWKSDNQESCGKLLVRFGSAGRHGLSEHSNRK
jgi:hypothetical protein